MHNHVGLADRLILVTLYDSDVDPRVHQIKVETRCLCDLWAWVQTLPDLPFVPTHMMVRELAPSSL